MTVHRMRKACLCGSTEGVIRTSNGQDCVYCQACSRFQYNAPKTETGRAVRTVSTTHAGISPGKRARVLLRANRRCELCGCEGDLHVAHLLSVKAGHEQGLSDAEINSDENLAAFCAECNLGLSAEAVPLRLAVAIIRVRARTAGDRSQGDLFGDTLSGPYAERE